ncbi:MAG TPA: DNRLRE domain-containing protein [Candidatus Polarisedimenticolaceae bacterium]|nr:DNRLRE domain-containing protein [Candidatus Polarisedimenticolaceae bacterium]
MLSLLLAAASFTSADLPSVRDNTIYEESADLSNGAGSDVFAGKTFSNLRRALVAFDVSAIPAGAVVQSATLRLTLTQAPHLDAQPVSVHRLVADWGEAESIAAPPGGTGAPAERGDATWLESFYQSTFWATAGGEFAASASAVTNVAFTPGVEYAWSSIALIADVQAWVDDSATNHGWILIGNESATRTARRFASRENSTAAFRPHLVVEYTIPAGGPGAVPDGGTRPGTPFKLARSGSTLSLSWSASCRPAADYVVQAGTLAALRTGTYDDAPLTCSTGGATSHTTGIPVASTYYLVLPLDGGATGSRGLTGAGAERPAGASACAAPSAAAPVCP